MMINIILFYLLPFFKKKHMWASLLCWLTQMALFLKVPDFQVVHRHVTCNNIVHLGVVTLARGTTQKIIFDSNVPLELHII